MANDPSRTDQMAWKALSTLSGALGGIVVRKLVSALWGSMRSSAPEPPLNPADRRVEWSTAVQWAVAAGVGAGVGRLISQRAAAKGWEAATGSAPPGVKT